MLRTAPVNRSPGAISLVAAAILVHGAATSGPDSKIHCPTGVITGTFGIYFFTRPGADPKE
tara:strand:- start:745 stop:927 length:183 start_codon:yes stop_codon:yes gene_type:complete